MFFKEEMTLGDFDALFHTESFQQFLHLPKLHSKKSILFAMLLQEWNIVK